MATQFEEARSYMTALETEMRDYAHLDETTPEQDARFDEVRAAHEAASPEFSALEARAAAVEAIRKAPATRLGGSFEFMKPTDTDIDLRTATRGEVIDAARKVADDKGAKLEARQREHLDRVVRSQHEDLNGSLIARQLVLTSTEAYGSAWQKYVMGRTGELTSDESRALQEFRAMSEGTSSAGGYGIPVLIDPTIVLTSQAAAAPILEVCRIETITTDAWKGVTSAGVSWEFAAEAAAAADASPTLTQPVVTIYRADGTIPYSIEVEQDYPGFAEEMARLLASGYVDLLAKNTAIGTGSTAPTGVFTAVGTTGSGTVATTTHGVLGVADVTATWNNLKERFRSRATWVMNVATESNIRTLATSGAGGTYVTPLSSDGIASLTGRQVLLSDYAPTQPSDTTAKAFAIVGDFSHYLVAQRAGMVVEPVSHIVDTSSGLPTGKRAWFAWARVGANTLDTSAFSALCNKTS